jgi:hypothetical protein
MELKATLETRKKKDGSGTYEVIVIKISENSEKLVFLNAAELELLKLKMAKNNDSNNEFPDLF